MLKENISVNIFIKINREKVETIENKAEQKSAEMFWITCNKSYSLVSSILRCTEVQPGLIPRGLLGSIPRCIIARMAKLVDAYDLKSYPSGCWFDSSYEQMTQLFFLRKNRVFNKSRYSRNRQLARVIFYFALYINILIIYGVFYVIYGLSLYHGWSWWLMYILYSAFFLNFFWRMTAYLGMFTYIYNTKGYRFLKSGLLVDFFFKKYTQFFAIFLFYTSNILFSEKYFVEYMFFRFNKFREMAYLYLDYFSNEFTYVVISVAIFSVCGLILLLLLNS